MKHGDRAECVCGDVLVWTQSEETINRPGSIIHGTRVQRAGWRHQKTGAFFCPPPYDERGPLTPMVKREVALIPKKRRA